MKIYKYAVSYFSNKRVNVFVERTGNTVCLSDCCCILEIQNEVYEDEFVKLPKLADGECKFICKGKVNDCERKNFHIMIESALHKKNMPMTRLRINFPINNDGRVLEAYVANHRLVFFNTMYTDMIMENATYYSVAENESAVKRSAMIACGNDFVFLVLPITVDDEVLNRIGAAYSAKY